MNFDFSESFYVEEKDIEEMCNNVKKGWSIQMAINDWASGLDDVDFYLVGFIEEQLADEIKKRLESGNPA